MRLVHDRIDATDLRNEREIDFQIKKAGKRLAVLGAWVAQPVVVAIDVDGVLNPTKRDQSGPGWESRDVVIRKELVHESLFFRGYGQIDINGTVSLNRSLHGKWLNGLLARGVEVVWASTWDAAANEVLAPLLGIVELPVAVSTRITPPRIGDIKHGDSAHWMPLRTSPAVRPATTR